MKKIAILTFHGSHNYGSCLQAYALQNVVNGFPGCCCEIINFRTDRQKDIYSVFTKRKGLRYLLKNAAHLLRFSSLKEKHRLFEKFISENLVLSKREFASLSELENANLNYDYYIVGSDQIWNPIPADFDWAYYLPFVKDKTKIAYAPSFGPFTKVGDDETWGKIKQYINDFDYLSVREQAAADFLKQKANKECELVLDPTLLLSKGNWSKLIQQEPIIKGKYILLYTLFSNASINRIAKKVSKILKMPVVVTNFSNQYDIFTSYKKQLKTGPKEFLNLLFNASVILATSFHGTVFSILFEKPFLTIDGDKDARIFNLLNIVGLQNNTVNFANVEEKVKSCFDTKFVVANKRIDSAREKSINYLKGALRVEDDENL